MAHHHPMGASGIASMLEKLGSSLKALVIKEKDKGRVKPSFPVRRMIAASSLVAVLTGCLILSFLLLSPYGEPPILDIGSLEAALRSMDGREWKVIDADKEEMSLMLSLPAGVIRTEQGDGQELLLNGGMMLSFIPADGAMECLYGMKRLRLSPYLDDRGDVASFHLTDGELSATFIPLQ